MEIADGLGDELETGNATSTGRKLGGILEDPVEFSVHVLEPSTCTSINAVERVVRPTLSEATTAIV